MIFIKNSEQIKQMKEAGRITGEAIASEGEMGRQSSSTRRSATTLKNAARVLRSSATAAFPEVPASASILR